MKFLLSPQAEGALDKQWDYFFERGGTRLADRVLADVYDGIARLIERPGLGHFRPDLTDKPLRFYRVHNMMVIYDPRSSPLYVAYLFHGALDIKQRMEGT